MGACALAAGRSERETASTRASEKASLGRHMFTPLIFHSTRRRVPVGMECHQRAPATPTGAESFGVVSCGFGPLTSTTRGTPFMSFQWKSPAVAGLTASFGLLLLSLPAFAQTTTIEGTVQGPDGKPVAGAVVKIERTDVKGNYPVKTDKKG